MEELAFWHLILVWIMLSGMVLGLVFLALFCILWGICSFFRKEYCPLSGLEPNASQPESLSWLDEGAKQHASAGVKP